MIQVHALKETLIFLSDISFQKQSSYGITLMSFHFYYTKTNMVNLNIGFNIKFFLFSKKDTLKIRSKL